MIYGDLSSTFPSIKGNAYAFKFSGNLGFLVTNNPLITGNLEGYQFIDGITASCSLIGNGIVDGIINSINLNITGFLLESGEVLLINVSTTPVISVTMLSRSQEPPVITSIPPTEVFVSNLLVYKILVDSDTPNQITFKLNTPFEWLSIVDDTLYFDVKSSDFIGIYNIVVEVKDNFGTVFHSFSIEIKRTVPVDDNPSWTTENYKQLIQLVILYPYNKQTGSIEPIYLSTNKFITEPTDSIPNVSFKAILKNKVVFSHKISAATDASSDFSSGQIIISNTNGNFDSWLTNYSFGYRKLIIYEGYYGNSFNSFNKTLEGVVGRYGISFSTTEITIEIFDKRELLNVPVQTETTTEGNLLPVAFGKCFNVSGILIDPVNLVYKLNFTTIKSVLEVRDAGASFTDFKVSGFNDYTVDLNNATVTLDSPPLGQVTFDIEGTVYKGKYLSTAADIVKYLILNKTTLIPSDIDESSFNYLNSVCNQTLGFYTNEKITVNDIYSQLFSSIGAYLYLTRGTCIFRCKRFNGIHNSSTSKLTINAMKLNTFEVVNQIPPIASLILGYKQNYTTIDQSSQAKAVSYISQRKSQELSEEWANRVAFKNTKIKNIYLDAIELEETSESENEVIPSNLTTLVDAVRESSRRISLYGRQRYTYSLVAFEELRSLEVGDIVTIVYNRFGFNYGKKVIIISLDENTDDSIKIEFWL